MRAGKRIGKPANKEGSEGEILLRRDTGGRTSIFGKINGIWNRVGLNVLGKPSLGSFAFFRGPNEIFHDSRFSIIDGVANFKSNLTVTGDIIAKGSTSEVAVVTTDAEADAGIQFTNEADGSNWNIASDGSDGHKLKIDKHWTAGYDTKLTIDNDGNVGIGTSSPNVKLDVVDGVIKVGAKDLYAANQDEPYLIVADDEYYTGETTNWGTYGMQHRLKTSDGGVPRLTIDTVGGERFSVLNNGNVGIGTPTPSVELDVNGTIAFASLKDTGESITVTKFVDEADGIGSNDNDTTIPTSAAVKDYVDTNVTAQDLDATTDSGTIDVDLDSETLTVAGGEGIDTSATGTTITIAGENATDSNKGVAKFNTANFSVSSGDVTIKDGGVDLTAEVTGVLPSANLDSDTAHLSGSQTFTGSKIFNEATFNTTTNRVIVSGDAITTAKDFSQLSIQNILNETDSDAAHFHANLELSIVDTDVGGYDQEGINFIFCHNESTTGGGGVSRTPHFRVDGTGNIISAGALYTDGVVDIDDTTDASSANGTHSSLRTVGGASIAKKLYVGTDLSVGGDLQVNGNDIAFDAAASTIAIDASAHDTAGQALTISAGDTTAGTTNNIAGGSLIFQGGQGKGSGAGGSIVFSVADGGSSGSSLNSLVTALTIDDNKDIICNGGPLHVKAPSGGSADLFLIADDEEDNPDIWRIRATDSAASNVLSFSNKISGSQVTHFTISPHATVTSSNAIFAGNVAVNGTSGITSGAVIWQYFPFHVLSATNGRYYYVDNDGYTDSARKWDSYDTDPTGFNYRAVAGTFVVPEDCTLVAMHGTIANQSSTNNPTITIYHGTVTEAASDTTLASAGAVTPTTGTLRVPFKFSKTDFDTDIGAGDIVVPTISHADLAGTRTFTGSLTLKFITR